MMKTKLLTTLVAAGVMKQMSLNPASTLSGEIFANDASSLTVIRI